MLRGSIAYILWFVVIALVSPGESYAADPFISTSAQPFAATSVQRMETYYENHKSGTTSEEDCITILNGALRQLLSDASQSVGSEIHVTAERLASDGHASERRDIEYKDVNGRNTRGVTKPTAARESIADIARQACARQGWYVFALSVADGYHSMTLAVDNTGASPKYYLADQVKGWVNKSSNDVDAKVLDWTQAAWEGATPSTRPRTRTTLWRVNP